ncbi:MAG: cytochrome c peroxidase [Nannocystaceae bacterium]
MNTKFCCGALSALVFVTGTSVAHPLPPAVADADYYDDGAPGGAKVRLGKKLFFDKILSGNSNTACATCHHPLTETGDGLSLPIGEGGTGLGITRDTGEGTDAVVARVPRNAPPLFDLGARTMTHMFHDGRIQANAAAPSGFDSPAGASLPSGLDNVLAVQAMFPVTSATEMAGQAAENDVADAVAAGDLAGTAGVWAILADRLRVIPQYATLFNAAYGVPASAITYVMAANAIAAYEARAFRSDRSPFDRYLRGKVNAMSPQAVAGMQLFYGAAGCDNCHTGPFQTDMDFHAIAMPQIGPGKMVGEQGRDDFGREGVTGHVSDRYRFRTPPLRNVALTAPYGHDGAYQTLGQVLDHHLDPVQSLQDYDCTKTPTLPSRPDLDALDCVIMDHAASVAAIASANELSPFTLTRAQRRKLLAFLRALTNPRSLDLRRKTPKRVPSGLPLAE